MNPLPQSAIINALPFLSAYSFNCAEQTFNKLLAHSIAIKLMQDNKDMQQLFLLNKEKVEKDTVQESQATPWLDLTNRIKKQQKELFNLLDEDRSAQKIDLYFKRLCDLQKGNGGLSWFDKGESDPYISAYVLTGFGKLREDSIKISSSRYENFIKNLVAYCDNILAQSKTEDENLLIARSYWMNQFPLSDTMKRRIDIVLKGEWKKIGEKNLQQKARLIIATRRFFLEDKQAMAALESLQQLAIKDDIGWRWKDIADADDLQTNGEETLTLLAEAFEGPQFKEVRTGILKWLLNTQSEHHWQTTKATAAAVKLLNTEKQSFEGKAQVMDAFAGDNKITVSNDVLSGNLFSFSKMAKVPVTVSLKKANEGMITGDFTAYYFRDWDKVKQTGSHVSLTRELLYQDGTDWKPVNKEMPLKVGDKVRVVLHIVSDKPLRYVYIDDKRAAAFEPEDVTSDNEYAGGFSYYRSVRDEGCQLFSSFLPSGENTITYNMTVAHEGQFSCGPASLECMYRPDVHAYSSPLEIKTIKR
jgi:uncharacterized protein YfaS (alpha-2-macroglobulin family)